MDWPCSVRPTRPSRSMSAPSTGRPSGPCAHQPVRATPPRVRPPWPEQAPTRVPPATLNTVNKLAAGIADSFALALLTECLGLDLPVFVAPNVNPALARHPRFRASLDELAAWGVPRPYQRPAPPPPGVRPWARTHDRPPH